MVSRKNKKSDPKSKENRRDLEKQLAFLVSLGKPEYFHRQIRILMERLENVQENTPKQVVEEETREKVITFKRQPQKEKGLLD